jgi:hypothetical protein
MMQQLQSKMAGLDTPAKGSPMFVVRYAVLGGIPECAAWLQRRTSLAKVGQIYCESVAELVRRVVAGGGSRRARRILTDCYVGVEPSLRGAIRTGIPTGLRAVSERIRSCVSVPRASTPQVVRSVTVHHSLSHSLAGVVFAPPATSSCLLPAYCCSVTQ